MTDYLTRLAHRALSAAPAVRPRLPSVYEPGVGLEGSDAAARERPGRTTPLPSGRSTPRASAATEDTAPAARASESGRPDLAPEASPTTFQAANVPAPNPVTPPPAPTPPFAGNVATSASLPPGAVRSSRFAEPDAGLSPATGTAQRAASPAGPGNQETVTQPDLSRSTAAAGYTGEASVRAPSALTGSVAAAAVASSATSPTRAPAAPNTSPVEQNEGFAVVPTSTESSPGGPALNAAGTRSPPAARGDLAASTPQTVDAPRLIEPRAVRRPKASAAELEPARPQVRPNAFPVREEARVPESATSSAMQSKSPDIHVTIGRVEIRARMVQPARAPGSQPTRPGLSLEAYLQGRNGAAR